MSIPICNCFHARRDNIGEIANFTGYPSLTLPFKPKGSGLKLLKSMFAGCLGLSQAISLQFTLKRCSQKCKKNSL